MEDLDYNSARPKLKISEYGRNIQKLIEHTKTIEDDEQRQKTAEYIIGLMHQMVPTNKGISEEADSLWKHFFRIADFDINVKPPEGINVLPKAERYEIVKLEYPETVRQFKHYGSLIQQLIERVKVLPDGPKKEHSISLIASYMKMTFRTWNREQFVNDDMVKHDLKNISDSALLVTDETNMNMLGSTKKRKKNHSNGGARINSNNNNWRKKNNSNRKRRKY